MRIQIKFPEVYSDGSISIWQCGIDVIQLVYVGNSGYIEPAESTSFSPVTGPSFTPTDQGFVRYHHGYSIVYHKDCTTAVVWHTGKVETPTHVFEVDGTLAKPIWFPFM